MDEANFFLEFHYQSALHTVLIGAEAHSSKNFLKGILGVQGHHCQLSQRWQSSTLSKVCAHLAAVIGAHKMQEACDTHPKRHCRGLGCLRDTEAGRMVEPNPSLRESLLGSGHHQDDAANSIQPEGADPRRWEQLAIFISLITMSQFAWIMYTAVPDTSGKAFNVPNGLVTFLATTCVNCELSELAAFNQARASRYPMLYFPGSLFAARAMRRGGLRATIVECVSR